jgi:hypothetical protein
VTIKSLEAQIAAIVITLLGLGATLFQALAVAGVINPSAALIAGVWAGVGVLASWITTTFINAGVAVRVATLDNARI